jgi:acyl dehydratase
VRPSRGKPDRGVVAIAYTVANQRAEPVMTYRAMHLLRRRPDGP